MKNNEEIQIRFVPVGMLEYNTGQIPGVPENPRVREDEKQKHLQQSIEELPEMTIARAALVYPYKDRLVVIGGNRRLEAQKALNRKKIPVIALPEDTPVEKLRRIALLDNESTGATDWGKLAKEWDAEEIKAWNIETPKGWFASFGKEQGESGDKEYDDFTKKFEPKLTTDDCYTPLEVYEVVKEWVVKEFNLQDKKIVRPFKPGGDYEKEMQGYDENTVVIDNPPFSIITEIQRKYVAAGVKYFLFAPHLTLFSSRIEGVSYVVTYCSIVYANGARVNTSFVTDLYEEPIVRTASDIRDKIKEVQEQKNPLPTYVYPNTLVTTSRLSHLIRANIDVSIRIQDTHRVAELDAQKRFKKSIYGNGLLVSEENGRILQELDEMADEIIMKREHEDVHGNKGESTTWKLSERERKMIDALKDSEDVKVLRGID